MFYDEMGLKQLKLTCLHEETSPRSKLLKKRALHLSFSATMSKCSTLKLYAGLKNLVLSCSGMHALRNLKRT